LRSGRPEPLCRQNIIEPQETVMSAKICAHLSAISTIKPAQRHECAECVKTGAGWVHLRTCQSCGATLCCDSSPNHHASRHAQLSGHPVIASAEPGERWLYCYPDDALVGY
jgi:hypothetical protein